jgi:hypothetical protein
MKRPTAKRHRTLFFNRERVMVTFPALLLFYKVSEQIIIQITMVTRNNSSIYYLIVSLLLYLLQESDGFQPVASSTIIPKGSHSNLLEAASPNNYCSLRNPSRENGQTSIQLFYQDDDNNPDGAFDRQRDFELKVNSVLRASQSSFQHVEGLTNGMLKRHPMIALAIFVGTGTLIAYLTGLFFLGGYIETWNPVENDSIPYWDDEILIISRNVGK